MDLGEVLLLLFVLGLWALSIYYFFTRYKKISTIERAEGLRPSDKLSLNPTKNTEVPSLSQKSLLKHNTTVSTTNPNSTNTKHAIASSYHNLIAYNDSHFYDRPSDTHIHGNQYDNSNHSSYHALAEDNNNNNNNSFVHRTNSSISIVGNHDLKSNHPPFIPVLTHQVSQQISNYSLFNPINNKSETCLHLDHLTNTNSNCTNTDSQRPNFLSNINMTASRIDTSPINIDHNNNNSPPQFGDHLSAINTDHRHNHCLPQSNNGSNYLSACSTGRSHISMNSPLAKEESYSSCDLYENGLVQEHYHINENTETTGMFSDLKRANSEPSVNLIQLQPGSENASTNSTLAVPQTGDFLNPQLIPSLVRKSLIDLHKKSMQNNLMERPHSARPRTVNKQHTDSGLKFRLFGLGKSSAIESASISVHEDISMNSSAGKSSGQLTTPKKTVFTQQRRSPNSSINVKGPENFV